MPYISTRLELIDAITKTLYTIDPAKTCCNMNEGMENEYAYEAALIANYFVDDQIQLKSAFNRAFNETFTKRGYDESKLNKAYRTVNDMLC